MFKKISTVLLFVAFFTTVSYSQWVNNGAFPDTSVKGGTHGIVVTPDGKIWTSRYYQVPWAGGNGVLTGPIIIFNPDGSVDDTLFTITTGSDIDTLGKGGSTSGSRGLSMDPQGNVYYVSGGPSKMIKINYQTRQGMARHLVTEIGSSPAGPAIANDGTVFLGPVVGGGTTAIAMYDADLAPIGSAVVGPPNIVRTFEVSPDGLAIYWTMFTGTQGIAVYTRPDIFSDFTMTDSLLYGMSIESAAWNPATGLLWVSNDSRGTDKSYTHLTWYGIDVTTKTLVDSFTLTGLDTPAVDELPRGLAFSADGATAYVGMFGSKYPLYKFSKATGVKDDPTGVVEDYTLSQNYPNPFNPSTEIKFTVKEAGMVNMKVYDMLGNEVATLVNENLGSGAYSVTFNASKYASGTYIYRLNVNGHQISKKMILMK